MSANQRFLQAHPHSVPFVDHKAINWEQVKRSHYWIYQRFRYEYPGPIQNLHQRLKVIPPDRHGDQLKSGHKLRATTSDLSIRGETDSFGNFVYFLDLPKVESEVEFEVWVSVERESGPARLPIVTARQAARFLAPTDLTRPDAALQAVAAELVAEGGDSWQIAERINTWVSQKMTYKGGVTTVATTAAQALALGEGLCQDYSHIMLTLCRLAGIPARYVSGHLLGEGGSHAWVEVLLPAPRGNKLVAEAYDPTNHCRASWRHITSAVGRDYRDVSPTSGYFTAPYSGRLVTSKRAGLLTVEYFDGEQITIDEDELIELDDQRWVA